MDSFPSRRAGTELQILETIARLDRSRFSPHLGCVGGPDHDPSVDVGCPVVSFSVSKLCSLRTLRGFSTFARYCRLHRIDVVQTVFRDANLIGTLWARYARIPVVVATRRNVGYWHTPLDRVVLRYLRRLTSHYVTNSEAAARACGRSEGVRPERVSVIPNGVEVRGFDVARVEAARSLRAQWGFPADALVIGAVGSLREVKDHASFVRVAELLHRERQDVRFVVVGEGPQRGDLERQIAQSGLEGVFVLPGESRDVARVLSALDVGVLCSQSESLSNALLEYMAAGLPVLASRVGGAEEVVHDGVDGILYDASDDAAFAAGLRRLCGDERLRRDLGASARQVATSRYGWPNVMQRTEALYERLLSESRRPPSALRRPR
jgi:glycosyltransferase involved in cell wall biosynthesis